MPNVSKYQNARMLICHQLHSHHCVNNSIVAICVIQPTCTSSGLPNRRALSRFFLKASSRKLQQREGDERRELNHVQTGQSLMVQQALRSEDYVLGTLKALDNSYH